MIFGGNNDVDVKRILILDDDRSTGKEYDADIILAFKTGSEGVDKILQDYTYIDLLEHYQTLNQILLLQRAHLTVLITTSLSTPDSAPHTSSCIPRI
jgi:hypothetical protein